METTPTRTTVITTMHPVGKPLLYLTKLPPIKPHLPNFSHPRYPCINISPLTSENFHSRPSKEDADSPQPQENKSRVGWRI